MDKEQYNKIAHMLSLSTKWYCLLGIFYCLLYSNGLYAQTGTYYLLLMLIYSLLPQHIRPGENQANFYYDHNFQEYLNMITEIEIYLAYCDKYKINILYRWFLFKTIRTNPHYRLFRHNRITEHYMDRLFAVKTWRNN